MNALEKWWLRRMLAREVRQGAGHDKRHVALYQMIRDAHRAEFTEDNVWTADALLREWFESTQGQI